MDATAGMIAVAALVVLLCLRRRRVPSDEAMMDAKRRQTASHWLEREKP